MPLNLTHAFAMAAAIALLAMAACGGGGDNELTNADRDYAAQVTRIGARASSLLQRLSSLETTTGFSDRDAAKDASEQLKGMAEEIQGLEAPDRFEGTQRSLAEGGGSLRKIGELNLEFIKSGDRKALNEARGLSENAFDPIAVAMRDVIEALRESAQGSPTAGPTGSPSPQASPET